MKAIYKYELNIAQDVKGKISGLNKILMPSGAKILDFQSQPHVGLCLWALVEVPERKTPKRDEESGELVHEEIPQEERVFDVIGTGWPFNDRDHAEYLGTTQDRNQMVWHLFEVVEQSEPVAPGGTKAKK